MPLSERLALGPARIAELQRQWHALRVRTMLQALAVAASLWVAPYGISRWAPTVTAVLGGHTGLCLTILGLLGVHLRLRRMGSLWTIVLAAGLSPAIALPLFGEQVDLAVPWIRAPWGLCCIVGLGVLGHEAWQRGLVLVRWSQIRRDLADGMVHLYRGTLARAGHSALAKEAKLDDGAGAPAKTAGSNNVASAQGDGPVSLAVLPSSRIAVEYNDQPLRVWRPIRVATVAPSYPHAFRVALPRGMTAALPGAAVPVHLERRSMTCAERAELDAHVRRLHRARMLGLAAMMPALFELAAHTFAGVRSTPFSDAAALSWYALAVVGMVAYLRRTSAARCLESDRNLRWVVTVTDQATASQSSPRLEVLPMSRLAWTENALPALWRTC